jgi:adenylate kinase
VPGVCDIDGGELYQRDDDRAETIANRLTVYADATRPLVNYYAGRGLLVGVDATGPVDDVTARAIDALRPFRS